LPACQPSNTGVARREIGFAELEVEWTEGPAERAGDLRKSDADRDVHRHHGRNDAEGVGASENLPRRDVGERGDRRGQFLLDAELHEAVEDGPLGARLVVIGVGAEIEAGLGRQDSGVDVGEAFDPGIGAKLGATRGMRGNGGAEHKQPKCGEQNARAPGMGRPRTQRVDPYTHLQDPRLAY
jgi:hypothetical protein